MTARMPLDAGSNSRIIHSKPFRKLREIHERQAFIGPPETTKDMIMGATKKLNLGQWLECAEIVEKMKFWGYWSDNIGIKQLLREEIKSVSLKTWLIRQSLLNTLKQVEVS